MEDKEGLGEVQLFASGLIPQENVSRWIRILTRETSPEGLLSAFRSTMLEFCDLSNFDWCRLYHKGGRISFVAKELGAKAGLSRHWLSAYALSAFECHLSELHGDQLLVGQSGVFLYQEKQLAWVCFGGLRPGAWLCFWEASRPKDEIFLKVIQGLIESQLTWFAKLDQTQSLLYLDELTGLFNYRYLDVALDSELRRANRYNTSFSLLFIDLDDFKKINDEHGHLIGSEVLRQFAFVLKEEVREVDSIIRYGGDEYVVLLIGSDLYSGLIIAERIRGRVAAKRFELGQLTVRLTCSLGLACYPEHGKSKDALLKLADDMMYKSKREGKNHVMVMGSEDIQKLSGTIRPRL